MPMQKFPTDLDEQKSPYIVLTPYKFQLSKIENQNPEIKGNKNLNSIYLPCPDSGVTESETQAWDVQERADQNFELDNVINIAKYYKDKLITESKPDVIQRQQEIKKGMALNSLSAVFFTGSEFREFTFNWELVPLSKDDASMLKQILDDIKNYSRASLIDQSYLGYPYFWKIKIYTVDNKGVAHQLFHMRNCVITNINIDYSPDGSMTLFSDGTPIKQNLSISFKELSKQYRNS